MNLTIKPLTPDLTDAYLDYFDNRAFENDDGNPNGPCFCNVPQMMTDEVYEMVREGELKSNLRNNAAQQISKGQLSGYLAFDGDIPIGWCNAAAMDSYPVNKWQFIPDFARQSIIGKTMSVVCFSIAPNYRGQGVSTALLERAIADAKAAGFAAVEGYAHMRNERDAFDFKGPTKLYEKSGFKPVNEQDGVVVMRKLLKEDKSNAKQR
jgi:GNAT superfamily N-acetyltransferase